MLRIDSLAEVLDEIDVVILDQWGVMHNGTTPYPNAVASMQAIHQAKKPIVVVSNSGKRADLNRRRIEQIGLPAETIDQVVTSGEALWEDFASGRVIIDDRRIRKIFPITGKRGDAKVWANDATFIEIQDELSTSTDAILLMGLPDNATQSEYQRVLQRGVALQCPMICSNPDKTSPRADGLVISPGLLADHYEQIGGKVLWYGKPHSNIYRAVLKRFSNVEPNRFLMVGDSLEHDVAGAQNLGLKTALICTGIHFAEFANLMSDSEFLETARRLAGEANTSPPDFVMYQLA